MPVRLLKKELLFYEYSTLIAAVYLATVYLAAFTVVAIYSYRGPPRCRLSRYFQRPDRLSCRRLHCTRPGGLYCCSVQVRSRKMRRSKVTHPN